MKNKDLRSEIMRMVTVRDVEVYEDPFSYFADVLTGRIKMNPYDLYALENNVMVVKILEAARKSAKTGKTIVIQ